MANTNWQVMPRVGEQYLETIGQEARLWHQFAGQSDYLTGRVEELCQNASLVEEEVISAAITDASLTDFEGLTHKLDEAQGRDIIRSHLAAAALKRLTSLDQGSNLDRGKRARLTVIKSGVYGKRFITRQEPYPETLVKGTQLEVDEVIEGTIYDLRCRPKLGGVLGLGKTWSTTYIHGLVNPATGDPRVNLEVMAKPES